MYGLGIGKHSHTLTTAITSIIVGAIVGYVSILIGAATGRWAAKQGPSDTVGTIIAILVAVVVAYGIAAVFRFLNKKSKLMSKVAMLTITLILIVYGARVLWGEAPLFSM